MTAAKVMDVIAKLPDCAQQAADAVSACAQVKMEDAPRLVKNSKVRMSRLTDTSSTTQVAEILGKHRRPRGSSRRFGEVLLRLGWEKSSELGMLVCSSKTRIVLIGKRA